MNIFSRFFSADRDFRKELKNLLGFSPGNIELYHMAYRHKQAALASGKDSQSSNERLEFLGDALLSAVVAEYVFKRFPYKEEGHLTEMRSRIVSRENLNRLGKKMGIDKFMKVHGSGPIPPTLLGNAFEALIGAIYLDKGYKTVQAFIINRIIKIHLDIEHIETTEKNFKSKIIEWAQKEKKIVDFELIQEIEGKNVKHYEVKIVIDGQMMGSGLDVSKKKAEQTASEKACKNLGI